MSESLVPWSHFFDAPILDSSEHTLHTSNREKKRKKRKTSNLPNPGIPFGPNHQKNLRRKERKRVKRAAQDDASASIASPLTSLGAPRINSFNLGAQSTDVDDEASGDTGRVSDDNSNKLVVVTKDDSEAEMDIDSDGEEEKDSETRALSVANSDEVDMEIDGEDEPAYYPTFEVEDKAGAVLHPEQDSDLHSLIPSPQRSRSSSTSSLGRNGTNQAHETTGHLQDTTCVDAREHLNASISLCHHCTWSESEACVFQGKREILFSEAGVLGYRLVPSSCSDSIEDFGFTFRDYESTPNSEGRLKYLKDVVCSVLHDILLLEQAHQALPNLYQQQLDHKERVTCDLCSVVLCFGAWICSCCGQEICRDCHDLIVAACGGDNKFVADYSDNDVVLEGHLRTKITSCSESSAHTPKDLRPTTWLPPKAVKGLIAEMEEYRRSSSLETAIDAGAIPTPDSIFEELLASPARNYAGHPSLATPAVFNPDIPPEMFPVLWKRGEPFVIRDLEPAFDVNPTFFTRRHGDEECEVENCRTDSKTPTTIGSFFRNFGKPRSDKAKVEKLANYPPGFDCEVTCPELFKMFHEVSPAPNYVRRDGVMNIASHHPINSLAPDIGPKLYCGQRSNHIRGSTRLHTDASGAMNVLLYATNGEDSDGYAIWSIVGREDTPAFEEFIRTQFKKDLRSEWGKSYIHSQNYYLSPAMLEKLQATTDIKVWHFRQRLRDAVFIPAGCPHQVTNAADCIKMAVDFVCPEDITRCLKLTREFRQENRIDSWKEDLLGLEQMLLYAWLSFRSLKAKQSACSIP